MERDVALGGEHKIKYTDDVPQNCKPETYKILLTNVTPIKSDHILKGNKIMLKGFIIVYTNSKTFQLIGCTQVEVAV